jgi:hypothetical protein
MLRIGAGEPFHKIAANSREVIMWHAAEAKSDLSRQDSAREIIDDLRSLFAVVGSIKELLAKRAGLIRGRIDAGGTVAPIILPVALRAVSKSRARDWSASPKHKESCDEDRRAVAA